MITFYPGPSKVYPQIASYLQDAIKEGILSQNHRSQAFMDILKECITLFKQKLNIPDSYHVYFTSSATECWEIVAQSLTGKGSYHLYNGAFGKKWFEYVENLSKFRANSIPTKSLKFNIEDTFDLNENIESYDVLCLTQNETSNGTQLEPNLSLNNQDNPLIVFDVTSSLGGISLDWQKGDVWLASSQKCLGLPAGLGVMICSPKALKKAEEIGERSHYNSLLFIHDNFQKYQTHYTPNVLGIYLLLRVMQQVPNIETISKTIKERAKDFHSFIETETIWDLLVKNPSTRSDTVTAIKGSVQEIQDIKLKAKENNIILGNGYGDWKEATFRVANFPAIEDWEFNKLKEILQR